MVCIGRRICSCQVVNWFWVNRDYDPLIKRNISPKYNDPKLYIFNNIAGGTNLHLKILQKLIPAGYCNGSDEINCTKIYILLPLQLHPLSKDRSNTILKFCSGMPDFNHMIMRGICVILFSLKIPYLCTAIKIHIQTHLDADVPAFFSYAVWKRRPEPICLDLGQTQQSTFGPRAEIRFS